MGKIRSKTRKGVGITLLQLLEALAGRAARVARAEVAVDNGEELRRAGAAKDGGDGAVGGLLAQQLQPLALPEREHRHAKPVHNGN